jgi:hypothetical protein
MREEQEQVNASTFEAALGYANQLRAMGINWDEIGNIAEMVGKIQSALNGRQDTNLLDVEDVLQEIVINVSLYNMRRDFGQAVYWVIDRHGKKDEESPRFIDLRGHMNDDDLQAGDNSEELKVDNDMSAVCSPECGPGSDMHIACLDIEEQLGEKRRHVFETRLTGADRREIANAFGYSYKEVRYSEEVVANFLERGEYTLDGTNRRLGSAKEFESGKVFFPAERRTVRTWELPDVDHRSTKYADIPEVDYTPLRPIGEITKTTDILYSDSTGSADTKIDDRNTTPGVVTERCKKLPGFTMNGHTIKDCSRKSVSAVGNSSYNYFEYCDELYSSTVRTREHLL